MNSPLHWQRHWTVDLDACEARHDSGLIVHYTRDAEGWSGVSPNIQEWFAQNPVERAKIAARLLREAGEVYKRALDERN
jgi:hypothetical protein